MSKPNKPNQKPNKPNQKPTKVPETPRWRADEQGFATDVEQHFDTYKELFGLEAAKKLLELLAP